MPNYLFDCSVPSKTKLKANTIISNENQPLFEFFEFGVIKIVAANQNQFLQ
jgi:hypothetical protein